MGDDQHLVLLVGAVSLVEAGGGGESKASGHVALFAPMARFLL
jgi:hypothetical protein